MKAIPRINLDQNNTTMIHRVFSTGNIESALGQAVERQNLKS